MVTICGIDHGVVGFFCLVVFCTSAQAQTRELRPVPAPDHDPLYVDSASVSRAGNRVSFKYVLDVPAALQGGEQRRWRSNEMTAEIDCAGNTSAVTYVEAYAGPAATGNVVGRYSANASER